MLNLTKNPFFLLLGTFMLVELVVSGEEDTPRVKRGAAVYITFPSGGPAPHVEKNPQDFINAVGANNPYSASAGYGGGLLAQYQQHGPSAGGGGHGGSGGGGSGYGRRKRSTDFQNRNNFNFEYNPYHSFDPPSWNSPQNLEDSYSYIPPSTTNDDDETSPFALNVPNPFSVSGLLEAATNNNKGLAAVFRAYTARTPYYGLNGSVDNEEPSNTTYNSDS